MFSLGINIDFNNSIIKLIDFTVSIFIEILFISLIYIWLPWLGITKLLNNCFSFNDDRKEIIKQIKNEFHDTVGCDVQKLQKLLS